MDASSAKLARSIAKVCRLSEAPATDETLDDAWDALRSGIVSARKDVDVFDACSEQEMDSVLAFLALRGTKKRSARGRVSECLRIVLSSASWLTRAQHHEVKASLQELLVGSTELLEKLEAVTKESDVSVESEGEAAPVDADAAPQPNSIRQQLAHGCRVLEGFGWRFPHDPLGTKLDDATEGFRSLFQGVTALTTPAGMALVGGDAGQALVELEGKWNELLQFLLSMYSSGVRGAYSARIRFVVVSLRRFSAEFRGLTPWRSLPWGHEPLPAAEAAEEEDRRLASELQSQEEAMMLSEREARRLRCQEDFSFARSLQERFDKGSQERASKAAASGRAGRAAAAGRRTASAGGC